MAKKLDVTTAQVLEVRRMAISKGIPRTDFQAALDDGRASAWLDGLVPIEKAVIQPPVPVETIFREIVLEPGKSLEEMFAAGRYNYLNPDINSEHFPNEGTKNLVEPVRVRIRFDRFGRFITEAEREAFFAQPGRVASTPTDAAAVGAQHRDFQRTHLCAFTSQFWLDHGFRKFVYLRGGALSRGAFLGWVGPGGRWRGGWWFASREVIL